MTFVPHSALPLHLAFQAEALLRKILQDEGLWRTVFYYVMQSLQHEADTQDVLQNCRLAFADLDQIFVDEDHARNWIFHVARNEAKKVGRRRKTRFQRSLSDMCENFDLIDPSEPIDTSYFDSCEIAEIRAAIRSLEQYDPDGMRVLVLRYHQGLARRAIAEIESLTEAVIRYREAKALDELRKLIDDGRGRTI